MPLSNYLFSALLSIALLISGCGPMNTEIKNDTVQTEALGQTSGPAKVTANNKFYISMNLADTNAVNGGPHEGENIFLIRSVRADDLHPLTSSAKVTVFYEMPTMPGMEMEDEATLQAEGSYLLNVYLSMPGLWKITLTIKDDNLQDEYVIETKI